MIFFGIGLTLREGNREYYYQKLDEHFPGLRQKYEQYYGERYIIHSPHNERLSKIVYEECKRYNIVCDVDTLFAYLHRYESKTKQEQLHLF